MVSEIKTWFAPPPQKKYSRIEIRLINKINKTQILLGMKEQISTYKVHFKPNQI